MPFCSEFYDPENGSDAIAGRTHAEWYESCKDLIGQKFQGTVPGHGMVSNGQPETFEGDITLENIQDGLEDSTFKVEPCDIAVNAILDPNRKMVFVDENGQVWGFSVG